MSSNRSQQRKVDSLGRPLTRPIQKNMFVTPGALMGSEVDIKELMKARIGSSDANYSQMDSSNSQVTDANTASQGSKVTDYGFEDYEIYLDSTARDQISELDSGVIQWTLTPYNGGQELRNIVEIFINKFLFPRVAFQDSAVPDYFYFNRVFVEIINTPTQSAIIAPNTTRFHFECAVGQINAQAIELIPVKQSFYFRRPLDSLGNIQLRFSVPSTTPNRAGGFTPINIPKENVVANLVAGSNPATFTLVNATTEVLGRVGVLPAGKGIAVYMSGASTGSTLINSQINSTSGIYVTNIINSTTFEVDGIDATTAVASNGILVYIPKNRIAITSRFSCVQPYVTNYIDISRP